MTAGGLGREWVRRSESVAEGDSVPDVDTEVVPLTLWLQEGVREAVTDGVIDPEGLQVPMPVPDIVWERLGLRLRLPDGVDVGDSLGVLVARRDGDKEGLEVSLWLRVWLPDRELDPVPLGLRVRLWDDVGTGVGVLLSVGDGD